MTRTAVLRDERTSGGRMVAAAVQRRRLLSYVARWGRARRWTPPEAACVLDIGSAFGYGTAALAARSGQLVVGLERDGHHIAVARRSFGWLPFVRGDATRLPFADQTVDAVTMLDVLEHLADPAAVLAEVHRVLRPGGSLVVSVPHRGLLEGWDSLNVYPRVRRASWPPLDPADGYAGSRHEHFSAAELVEVLGPGWEVEQVARTGLGLAEPFHLAILVVVRGILRMERVYRALLLAHLLVYVLDDALPCGALSYYLTVRATASTASEGVKP